MASSSLYDFSFRIRAYNTLVLIKEIWDNKKQIVLMGD